MRVLPALLLSAFPLLQATAQQHGRISGTVRDSRGQAIVQAEVAVGTGAQTENRRTITDSSGAFFLGDIPAGQTTVRIRRIGFRAVDTTVTVLTDHETVPRIVLDARDVVLDTVKVKGDRECPPFGEDGFACRRGFARGVFLDAKAMDSLDVRYAAEMFQNRAGFRVIQIKPLPLRSPLAVESTAGWRCLSVVVDGQPANDRFNPPPTTPEELFAVEIYSSPRDIPPELQRFMWKIVKGVNTPCPLIMYWRSGGMRKRGINPQPPA